MKKLLAVIVIVLAGCATPPPKQMRVVDGDAKFLTLWDPIRFTPSNPLDSNLFLEQIWNVAGV